LTTNKKHKSEDEGSIERHLIIDDHEIGTMSRSI